MAAVHPDALIDRARKIHKEEIKAKGFGIDPGVNAAATPHGSSLPNLTKDGSAQKQFQGAIISPKELASINERFEAVMARISLYERCLVMLAGDMGFSYDESQHRFVRGYVPQTEGRPIPVHPMDRRMIDP